jgi:ribosome-binding protein aMBF1 (putative translation factor)
MPDRPRGKRVRGAETTADVPRPAPPSIDRWAPTGDMAQLLRAIVAKNVREARVQAGMSQRELERASHLKRETIARLERANQEPRLISLVALSFALGVPLGVILAGMPEGRAKACRA